ncbi:COM1 regulatory protein [Ophiocordyceps camponoti-floridani]|uniref:COM1 regulatory protein n=1 Tax=Ophiocordyceps camponoti-floridani TaxID=2030778 RepID=A0A8H4VF71_9HYPO|nr:COM1 regulatory protein [Ophiocordyceps camponoti-floridani]
MNSLKVPESGLLLDAPSHNSDSASPPQAFVLSLGDSVVEHLIQSARNGEDLHLALGDIPTLHYGTQSCRIAPPQDDVPYDLFLTKPFESTRKAERLPHTSSLFQKPKASPVSDHKKTSAKAAARDSGHKTPAVHASGKSSTSSALDSDIEALQNGLAAHDAGRDRARMVEKLPASRKGPEKMKSKLWANYNSASKSLPTSPALNNSAGSPSSTPTLSASQQAMERKKEQRVVLVHELAVRDRSADYLREKWTGKEEEFQPTLEKMAEYGADSKKWAMKKTCWKELDVWKYDYGSQEDRQTAIDNAIRQYDKQRLSSSEVEWQRLLPVDERGKGKCLSRLQANLAKGPAQPVPKSKGQRADDDEGGSPDGGEKLKVGGESLARSNSNQPPSKPKKASAHEAQTKRLLGNTKAKAAPLKTSPTKTRAAGGKATNGNTRVLSAAIIENSDSSGDEAAPRKSKTSAPSKPKDTVIVNTGRPQSKASAKPPPPPPPPPAASSSQPSAKRSREDDDSSSSSGTPLSKRIKPKQPLPPSSRQRPPNASAAPRKAGTSTVTKSNNSNSNSNKKTSPNKSSPLASSPPTNASELDEETPPAPAPKRKAESEGKGNAAKRRAVESVSTEVLSKAHKFKAYYQKYEALHWEISALDDPPREKLADLLDMRGRLQMMKIEIYKQYSPERD